MISPSDEWNSYYWSHSKIRREPINWKVKRLWRYEGDMNFHMSHYKIDRTEQQFNDIWDHIFKLLIDLGYDISMLISVNYDGD